jgi:hypothetical protein
VWLSGEHAGHLVGLRFESSKYLSEKVFVVVSVCEDGQLLSRDLTHGTVQCKGPESASDYSKLSWFTCLLISTKIHKTELNFFLAGTAKPL